MLLNIVKLLGSLIFSGSSFFKMSLVFFSCVRAIVSNSFSLLFFESMSITYRNTSYYDFLGRRIDKNACLCVKTYSFYCKFINIREYNLHKSAYLFCLGF